MTRADAAPRFISPSPSTTPRLVDLVEAAYDLDAALDDWIAGVLVHADELDHGLGVFGFLQRIAKTGIEQLGVVVRGGPEDLERIVIGRERLSHSTDHVSFAASPLMRSGSYRAQIARAGVDVEAYDRSMGDLGLADLLGISTNLGGGLVFSLVAPTPTPFIERPSQIQRYQRLGAHLGAGLRLRERLADPSRIPELVFRPDGKLMHAETGLSTQLLERARAGLMRTERARDKTLRQADPDQSLSLWQGLVTGRWSLVDRHEGSHRYVVAYKNELDLPRPPTLTSREAQVARFIVGGASLKETAYALGVSVSTVHDALTRAMKKLKVTHRTELAVVWQRAQGIPETDLVKVPLAKDPSDALAVLADLTPAEREVAALIAEGRSTAEIAEIRGTSSHTTSNQLSALYDKLGVRSRGELAALLAGTRGPEPENSLFR